MLVQVWRHYREQELSKDNPCWNLIRHPANHNNCLKYMYLVTNVRQIALTIYCTNYQIFPKLKKYKNTCCIMQYVWQFESN